MGGGSAPGIWIGNEIVGAESPYALNVDASDPDIDLNSARLDYEYRVAGAVVDARWNGNPLPFSPSVGATGATFSTPPQPVTLNAGANSLVFTTSDPSAGFVARVTLRYNCGLGQPVAQAQPVPADASWALLAGVATLLGAATYARRRQRG